MLTHPNTLFAAAWVLTPLVAGGFLLAMAWLVRREDGPGREPAFLCVASCLAFGAALLIFQRV
jgi:hypothetical protein